MKQDDFERIQQLAHESYLATGSLMAYQSLPKDDVRLAAILDKVSHSMEAATVELRNLCERNRPRTERGSHSKADSHLDIAGAISMTGMEWLHIKLNTLLPPSRYKTPAYLVDTIKCLLDRYEAEHGGLPRFEQAMLVIDEHCNAENRQIYDQDNKGWRAISNVLKGRLFDDDDQFTLHLALTSTVSEEAACHIYILPQWQADDYFYMRNCGLSIE